MPIEIGTIYILPLIKKIPNANLLIFDVGGESGRLHISQLSNNIDLNQRMFELFEVGQEVTVMVNSINREKDYIELSTKAFRNYLDASLPFLRCKEIIKSRYDQRGNQDLEFLVENRRILNRLRGDLSSTGLTFLYELLQNAVDHPNSNFNNKVSVHFELFKDFLLLKHNGALFTENNFKSITGILYGEEQNEGNVRRIGYKGIGFKSVFRHSNNVYVRSGNFSFSFSKELTGAEKPWEVMPLFQDERDKIQEIPQFDFFNSPVAFAFEFLNDTSKEDVVNYLKELAQNPYLLIFLDNLIELKITLSDDEFRFEKEFLKEDDIDIIRLKDSMGQNSDWVKFSNQYEITDEEIIAELTNENNTSIPSNFRQFRNPKIEVVIPKEPEPNLINLFTYLPLSRTQYELPFIINSDFIPNLDRTNIIDSLNYNRKVVEYAGMELLNSCQSLGQKGKFELQKTLIPNYNEGNIPYKNIIRQTFFEKINQYVLFPNHYGDNLINLESVIIDNTGMQNLLSEEQYSNLIVTDYKPIAINYGDSTIINTLIAWTGKGKTYTVDDLTESINKEVFQDWLKKPENNIKFINHLYGQENLKPLLKESIILTNQNNLKKASEILEKTPEGIKNFNPETIHTEVTLNLAEEVILNFKKYERGKWFDNRVLINPINDQNTVDSCYLKMQWNWVYDEWENIQAIKEITNNLKSKKILCKNNQFNPMNESYVSEEYQTDAIESIVNELNIVDAHFISERMISEKRTKDNWLKIFKKLKAKADLEDVLSDVIGNLSQYEDDKHFRIGQEVFKYWKKNKQNEEKKLSDQQITQLVQNLRIKCVDSNYYNASDTILSDQYRSDNPLSSVLPAISFKKELSKDYDPKKSDTNNWFEFFTNVLKCQNILEKQEVFDKKIKYYVDIQDFDQSFESHINIINQINSVINSNQIAVKKILFNGFKLLTNQGNWERTDKLYFSSQYSPILDLQKDESLTEEEFISDAYFDESIPKNFLTKIGLEQNFHIQKIEKIQRSELPLAYRNFWEENHKIIRTNAENYAGKHIIENHIYLKRFYLLKRLKYSKQFWTSILDNSYKIELIFNQSKYRTAFNSFNNDSLFLFEIKSNRCFPNLKDELCFSSNLYSYKLKPYINNESYIPFIDFSNITANESDKDLEELIGINQKLSPELALELIVWDKPNLTKELVKELDLINILSDAELVEDKTYFLPNVNYTWKPTKDLFTTDEGFVQNVNTSNRLHSDFQELAEMFDIEELSEQNLVVKVTDECNVTEEVQNFFQERAKFLACKLNNGYEGLEELEAEILEGFRVNLFYECSSIDYVFPQENPIYQKPVDFYHNNEVIKFTKYWKQNEKVRQFLYTVIDNEQLPRAWFDNLINRWNEKEIIARLEDDFGQSPWNRSENDESKNQRNFIQEVEDYIDNHLKEVEDIYEDDRITQLKNMLQNFSNHTRGKQKAFNMLAKLKLCKKEGLLFDKDWKRNEIEVGDKKFFIHSARGAFSYIHPNEILRMRDEGFKMAIDYGRLDIRIYETAEEIIGLYQNFLMLYQSPENPDDVMRICEESTSRSQFHFLIVDREKQTDDVKAILKLMNVQNYE